MGHDYARTIRIVQRLQDRPVQRVPHLRADIGRIDIGDLAARKLRFQPQSAHAFEILRDPDLARAIILRDRIARDPGDGAAGGENGEPGRHARRLAADWRSRQLILRFAALCAADRHTGGTRGWGD